MEILKRAGNVQCASVYGHHTPNLVMPATIAAKAAKALSQRKQRRLLISLGQASADESSNDLQAFLASLDRETIDHEGEEERGRTDPR